MEDATTRTVLVRIHGRVQGVWYRGWTVETAQDLGLTGWVRNRSDGTVEALLRGPTRAVTTMITACHQGPPAARVTRVEVQEEGADADIGCVGFRQIATM